MDLTAHVDWYPSDHVRAIKTDDRMTLLPSSGRVRSWFGAAAATLFAFSGLFFISHDEDLGFGTLAMGLVFLTFALTFRWTPSVERLRKPPKK